MKFLFDLLVECKVGSQHHCTSFEITFFFLLTRARALGKNKNKKQTNKKLL